MRPTMIRPRRHRSTRPGLLPLGQHRRRNAIPGASRAGCPGPGSNAAGSSRPKAGPAHRARQHRHAHRPRRRTTPSHAPRRAARRRPSRTNSSSFVEGATGRLLPIFGSPFFADAADTFQSVDNVPVSADYTVGPGDEIVTRAWGAIDVDYRSTVDRNGMLNLPKVGSFNVAGVKASDLEKNLRAQIGAPLQQLRSLSVSLGQLRGLQVFVVGPAQRPGVYTLSSQSTLLSAVVAAGGPGRPARCARSCCAATAS